MLKLSKNLDMPIAGVTQTFAFLGKRGGGKTYAAGKLAEEMLIAGAQIIVLDVVGTWYGLRIPKDKRNAPFDVVVFGGENGDIEINPKAGKIVAGIILEKNLSAVVDISQFIHSEQTRFSYDFLITLFEGRKKAPGACHVFLEEAQELVPQNLPAGSDNFAGKMLHAGERMVKLGRNFGIGCTLISQRPQEVNKKVLNQTEVLLAFQMTGIQEKKTIATWVKDKGDDTDVEQLLPKLATGEALIWSPTWLKISGTYKLSEKLTADVSATPEVGAEPVRSQKLAPVDVAELKDSISALTEEMEANTPAALKKKIAEQGSQIFSLTNELKNAPKPIVEQKEVEVIREVLTVDQEAIRQLVDQYSDLRKELTELVGQTLHALNEVFNYPYGRFAAEIEKLASVKPSQPVARSSPSNERPKQATPQKLPPIMTKNITNGDMNLSDKQQKILDVLLTFEHLGRNSVERSTVAVLIGVSAKSSTFRGYQAGLKAQELIEYQAGNLLALSDVGRSLATISFEIDSLSDLHNAWKQQIKNLTTCQMLDLIILAYPELITREDLSAETGVSITSSTFRGHMASLKGLGLIEYKKLDGQDAVVATDLLFPEGLR